MLHCVGAVTVFLASLTLLVGAFDNSRYDNVAVYWGQNSYGAIQGSDTANYQKRLSYYCNDNAVDVFPVAFLNVFFGTGGAPSINLANTCNSVDNATFPGTSLPNCASLASDITTCQSKGKVVTLSLGGANGGVGFQSDTQASTFAQTVWDMFLGGSSSTRPFGSAVLDGVDLDIEGGTSDHYDVFVNQIRSLASGAPKKYYVTAAPQCVYPDAALGGVLNKVSFDAIYVQFYNNPCGLTHFAEPNNWNFGIWDIWARTISPNMKNVKVYIGAPGAPNAAGTGYVPIDTLKSIAVQMRNSFSSFGGVMLWDASQAYWNSRYDLAIKNALTAAGGTGFTYPACSAPAYVAGTAYTGGSKVTYDGYIWQAKWWSSSTPAANPNGDWSAISACGGAPVPTSTSTATSPPTSTSTSTSQTPTPTPGGNCSGVAAWSSTTVYTKGLQAVYDSHLWTAQWWTQNDTPGGAAGAWADNGPCGSQKQAADTSSAKTKRTTSSENVRPTPRVRGL